jgi:hypothetical protein
MLAYNIGRTVNKVGLLAIACLLTCAAVSGAEPVTIQATLILASNDPAPMDSRLDRIEYKLRRIFGFEYYRHYGEGSALLNLPGESTVELGHGFRITMSSSGSKDGKIRTSVQWFRGDEMVLNTIVGMKRGVPVILGGISHEGGTLIVTLVAE